MQTKDKVFTIRDVILCTEKGLCAIYIVLWKLLSQNKTYEHDIDRLQP